MDADIKKMKMLAKAMRNAGILHYKTPEVELSLSEKRIDIPEDVPSGKILPDNSTEMPAVKHYTEEEILLWSTGAMTPEQLEAK
jgi:hypothetical protein